MLPPDLRARISQRASELGVSMGEYIRRTLVVALDEADLQSQDEDSLFANRRVFEGLAPLHLAKHHDRHLYGDPE